MDSDNELDIIEQAERQLEDDTENVQEVEQVEAETEEVQADHESENEDAERKVIKPKRVVRNPQPKLNAETLRAPRGLTALPALFAKQKFKGKGHEETDLNLLLKGYEYWCHRLFPKLQFDQCIEKIETLGSKKPVMTYVKRIRMGLLEEEEPEETPASADQEPLPLEHQEHIASVESRFDQLTHTEPQPVQLTDEQLEMIRANKERALKLRQERLRRAQEQAQTKLVDSSSLSFSQSEVTSYTESIDVSASFDNSQTNQPQDQSTDTLTSNEQNEKENTEMCLDDIINQCTDSVDKEPCTDVVESNQSDSQDIGEEMVVDDILNNIAEGDEVDAQE